MIPDTQRRQRSVSIVIPCLNEESSLPLVLEKAKRLSETAFEDREIEVIVSDNGSKDRSVDVASQYGARVVHCSEKGYGAALRHGISAATGEIVVFADADNTYDLAEAPRLVQHVENGFALVLGSRLQGKIHQGAMPLLHRYLGTPVLNFFINRLYGNDRVKITDCNSGFRAFERDAFLGWNVQSPGMEFASEMLVKALRAGSSIMEAPVSLYPAAGRRRAHLQRWRDGMRHLLQILLEAPKFFYTIGLWLFVVSWTLLLTSLAIREPISLGMTSLFGIHTMTIALLGSFFGLTFWAVGLFLAARGRSDVPVYRYLIELSEDVIFWSAALFLLFCLTMLALVFISWTDERFNFLTNVKEIIAFSALVSNGLLLISHVVTAHLIKRA